MFDLTQIPIDEMNADGVREVISWIDRDLKKNTYINRADRDKAQREKNYLEDCLRVMEDR